MNIQQRLRVSRRCCFFKMAGRLLLAAALTWLAMGAAQAACPWGRDPMALTLQSTCLCNVNPETGALSVQCQAADFRTLMRALQSYASGADTIIENLYINNTAAVQLTDFLFKDLKIINLQVHNNFRYMSM